MDFYEELNIMGIGENIECEQLHENYTRTLHLDNTQNKPHDYFSYIKNHLR